MALFCNFIYIHGFKHELESFLVSNETHELNEDFFSYQAIQEVLSYCHSSFSPHLSKQTEKKIVLRITVKNSFKTFKALLEVLKS